MSFVDRRQAGRRLGARLRRGGYHLPVVLGLPRGGVPVAYEVAQALGAPLDVLVVRKLGCPGQPELGLGALGEGGVRLLNYELIREAGVSPRQLEAVIRAESVELDRRVARYRGRLPAVDLAERTVLLVDDGLATGFTARAATEVARARKASRVVLAVPAAPLETVAELAEVADEVVCLETPEDFTGVGGCYEDFSQTQDEEVRALLTAAPSPGRATPRSR
jgi:putative phosphoribosyl transferase